MAAVIFLSGPPKAGKSHLRGDIYRVLLTERHPSFFVQVLSPDAEGQWTNDCYALGRGEEAATLARRQKNAVKESGQFFSPAFVAATIQQLAGLLRVFDLVVGDLGGVPSAENRQIVDTAIKAGSRILPVVVLHPVSGDGGWVDFWVSMGFTPYISFYETDLAKKMINDIYLSICYNGLVKN